MRRSDHYRLGLFVLVGSFLLLVVITVLGGGNWFRKVVLFETYLNESVNGLEVGSPVKYRGVQVGNVRVIGFVTGRYVDAASSDQRYVYVEFEMEHGAVQDLTRGVENEAQLAREIKSGLRVRPISQGLTGQLVLGIDYVDPAANPPLTITWEPRLPYIPSAPSTLSRVEQAVTGVSYALGGLNKDDISGLLKGFRAVAENMAAFLERAGGRRIGELLQQNLEQTRDLFTRVNGLLGAPGTDRLLPETAALVGGLRSLVDESRGDVVQAFRGLARASGELAEASHKVNAFLDDPGLRRGLGRLPETLDKANNAVAEFEAATTRFRDAMSRIDAVVADQQLGVGEIMDNVRGVTQNLRELTEELKRHPSGALFGAPPGPVLPSH
ncbi:MAG: MlaD family protein [Desulfovibrionaceae bacterium]